MVEEMVFADARRHLSRRVRFALDADRRIDRRKRHFAGSGISCRGARATWWACIVDLANALLVQPEQRILAFSLRRGRCFIATADFRNRSSPLSQFSFR